MIKKRGNNKWLQTRIKYQICGFYVVLFIDKTRVICIGFFFLIDVKIQVLIITIFLIIIL